MGSIVDFRNGDVVQTIEIGHRKFDVDSSLPETAYALNTLDNHGVAIEIKARGN